MSGFFTDARTEYGAVGNGTTNDQPAIQNAINAAYTAGGGTVLLPQGAYRVDTPLIPKAGVTLQGVAPWMSIAQKGTLLVSGAGQPVIRYIGTDGNYDGQNNTGILQSFSVFNLSIRGGGRTNTNANGIEMTLVNRITIRDVYFFACHAGIKWRNAWQCTVDNCHLWGGENDRSRIGFYHAQSMVLSSGHYDNAVIYSNCVAAECEQTGWRMETPQGSKLINCEANLCGGSGLWVGDPGAAVYDNAGTLIGSEFLHVANCLFDTNGEYGIRIGRGGNSGFSRKMHFSNCWVGTSGSSGILADSSSELVFTGLKMNKAGNNGIAINNCNQVVVSGACINDITAGSGVWMNNSTDLVFDGLKMNSLTDKGIAINNCNQVVVGNSSISNTTNGSGIGVNTSTEVLLNGLKLNELKGHGVEIV